MVPRVKPLSGRSTLSNLAGYLERSLHPAKSSTKWRGRGYVDVEDADLDSRENLHAHQFRFGGKGMISITS